MSFRSVPLLPLFVLALAGCQDPLSGHVWAVDFEVIEDTCNDPDTNYSESLDIRIDFEGGDGALLAVGPDAFAAGQMFGCFVDYQSVAWTEERGIFTLTWQLVGEAQVRAGGTSCNLDNGVDWEGTETFTILSSDDPDISTGCRTVLSTRGTYVGEL